jgi:tetratricopeptide (TPR) repeat protein
MMKMKYFLVTLSCLFAFSSLAFSQKEVRKELRKGNKEYKLEKYTEAEINYRKALEANARSTDAAYNLGNSLYRQQKLPEAMEQYQATIQGETDKNKLAKTWHNAGNVALSAATAKEAESNPQELQKALQQSIEAYKHALRNNPHDDETRYNLALAQKLLEDQQNQDQDQNQDQNQDQKQDQDQDQDQKQDQQQQDKKQDQQEQQQNPNEMQKQNAEQILDAMMQNERETQEKVKQQQMQQQQQRKTEKNW